MPAAFCEGINLPASCWVSIYLLKQVHLCFLILDAVCQWKPLYDCSPASCRHSKQEISSMAFPSISLPMSSESSSSLSHRSDGNHCCWQSALLDQWFAAKNHPPTPTGHTSQEYRERTPDHMASYLRRTRRENNFCLHSREDANISSLKCVGHCIF